MNYTAMSLLCALLKRSYVCYIKLGEVKWVGPDQKKSWELLRDTIRCATVRALAYAIVALYTR